MEVQYCDKSESKESLRLGAKIERKAEEIWCAFWAVIDYILRLRIWSIGVSDRTEGSALIELHLKTAWWTGGVIQEWLKGPAKIIGHARILVHMIRKW